MDRIDSEFYFSLTKKETIQTKTIKNMKRTAKAMRLIEKYCVY
jgi:hypothetical protein